MVSEKNSASITGKISDGMSTFESYNNKEIYRFDGLGFAITGRLVSGLCGFVIIVLMLMYTFSSAASSIMVADLGGSNAFVGDVEIIEEAGPTLSGTMNPGSSVDFGYIIEDTEWDYTSNLRLSHIEVVVNWEANGAGSVGARQVTFQVSTQNDTTGETQDQSGFDGTMTVQIPIQMLPETVSGTADSVEAFVGSYETEGEWAGGTFTYNSGSTITNDNSISYSISLKVYVWDIQNVRETII